MEGLTNNGKIAVYVDGKEVELQPTSEVESEFADGMHSRSLLSTRRTGKSYWDDYVKALKASLKRQSRNAREGHYIGKINGRHRRSFASKEKWEVQVWHEDAIVYSYPVKHSKIKR